MHKADRTHWPAATAALGLLGAAVVVRDNVAFALVLGGLGLAILILSSIRRKQIPRQQRAGSPRAGADTPEAATLTLEKICTPGSEDYLLAVTNNGDRRRFYAKAELMDGCERHLVPNPGFKVYYVSWDDIASVTRALAANQSASLKVGRRTIENGRDLWQVYLQASLEGTGWTRWDTDLR